jgi:hypothetical protein
MLFLRRENRGMQPPQPLQQVILRFDNKSELLVLIQTRLSVSGPTL